jgi:hypothetical protein
MMHYILAGDPHQMNKAAAFVSATAPLAVSGSGCRPTGAGSAAAAAAVDLLFLSHSLHGASSQLRCCSTQYKCTPLHETHPQLLVHLIQQAPADGLLAALCAAAAAAAAGNPACQVPASATLPCWAACQRHRCCRTCCTYHL